MTDAPLQFPVTRKRAATRTIHPEWRRREIARRVGPHQVDTKDEYRLGKLVLPIKVVRRPVRGMLPPAAESA